jgi:D-amino-acid dehydrogenase
MPRHRRIEGGERLDAPPSVATASPAKRATDAYLVACGSVHHAAAGNRLGHPIYPRQRVQHTLPLLKPERAPHVSMIDDAYRSPSRLGNQLRVASLIELGGFDLARWTPLAKALRHAGQAHREVFPGITTPTTPEGRQPCSSGRATPTNIR